MRRVAQCQEKREARSMLARSFPISECPRKSLRVRRVYELALARSFGQVRSGESKALLHSQSTAVATCLLEQGNSDAAETNMLGTRPGMLTFGRGLLEVIGRPYIDRAFDRDPGRGLRKQRSVMVGAEKSALMPEFDSGLRSRKVALQERREKIRSGGHSVATAVRLRSHLAPFTARSRRAG